MTILNFAEKEQSLRAMQIRTPQSTVSNSVAVYIHIPFCHHRCSYCDFNIYAGMRSIYQPYAESIAQEIAATAQRVGRQRVRSIFFGGGTPSMFPIELIGEMLASVRAFFDVEEGVEITLEVNPTTDDRRRTTDADSLRSISSGLWSVVRGQQDYFTQLKSLGFNRLSLGVQSSHEDELHLLRRGHSFEDAVATYRSIREAGFDNVNLDLIYALPNQPLAKWRTTLERVIDLKPEHISAYSLQIEERTAMFNWVRDRKLPTPEDEIAAEMYELAESMLVEAGFEHYEISNWASKGQGARGKMQVASSKLKDFRSRHNLVYWLNEPYFGFGCGAHSSFNGHRFSNALKPRDYIQRIGSSGAAVVEDESIDRALEMGETMMLGLRLIDEGVNRSRFRDRFGVMIEEAYGSIVERLIDEELVELNEDCLRLTPRGRLLGNRVFGEFLPEGKPCEG
jgi:oxygen-independent coproporphyrinogen-3 oxidase